MSMRNTARAASAAGATAAGSSSSSSSSPQRRRSEHSASRARARPASASASAAAHAGAMPASGAETTAADAGVPDSQLAQGDGGETDPLLETGAQSDSDSLALRCRRVSIYPMAHLIRRDIRGMIDTALSFDELHSVDVNFTVVRPLALKYARAQSIAIIYTLLLVRCHFASEAERDLAFASVNATRASLCELLAIKLLRTFSRDGLELVTALTAPFDAFSGAPSAPSQAFAASSALDLAIASSAKRLLSCALVQRVANGIWDGRVVVCSVASHAIVDDSYKQRPLAIYDLSKAPFLDHYRLRVPKIRAIIEGANFMLLCAFYVLALRQKGTSHWTGWETVFVIWVLGFALDEVAQLREHGYKVYTASLYNLLDAFFCAIAFTYLGIRLAALSQLHPGAAPDERSALAFDVLAVAAVLLFPRVVATLVAQDSVMLLALKAMVADFVFFMALAAVCFSGFAYAFYSLNDAFTLREILWIMLKVWFGNSYVGFDAAAQISEVFGPGLMVLFAVLANTLLLTGLISLLSNTYSVVAASATEEVLYQHACKTMAGITSDALFSYPPPLNLLALAIVLPASWVLSPRWTHKLNVALIRTTSLPILLLIRVTSRQGFRDGLELTTSRASRAMAWLPRRGKGEQDLVDALFARAPASDDDNDETHMPASARGTFRGQEEEEEHEEPPHARQETSASPPRTPARGSAQTAGYGSTSTTHSSMQQQQRQQQQEAAVHRSRVDDSSTHQPPASAPAGPARASDAHSRPASSAMARGLGTLSSPLARFFSSSNGALARRAAVVAHSSEERSGSTLDAQSSAASASAASRFSGLPIDTCSAFEEQGTASGAGLQNELLHAVMERLELHEKRSKRIEELLLRLVDRDGE
ncbi:hypothetical protein FA09DRAFT_330328 [Tilletiopsis washingtonensis]|uniref:Ion transport domain-containing protein n=1 Tax=Tilletiopsis washingtonensis TaxID=58919 RepID=A0A316Z7B6_9BASI|nr:hypothetical protein FA09DRAFT_330328 [Tilletiopsis washingtonensis]PWN97667.1 hypothetical protein FA09DRAFT_330328 [Tilletiopsis washingtonensis]